MPLSGRNECKCHLFVCVSSNRTKHPFGRGSCLFGMQFVSFDQLQFDKINIELLLLDNFCRIGSGR